MRLQAIEATLQADIEYERLLQVSPTTEFLERFRGLMDHFDEVYAHTALNKNVEHYDADNHSVLAMAGFTFVDALPDLDRILSLYPRAFDNYQTLGARPGYEVDVAIRADSRDAIVAETRLRRAEVDPSGAIRIHDTSSYDRRNQYTESISLPDARPVYYPDDDIEYKAEIDEFVVGNVMIPRFTGPAERFDSLHAALDVINSTPSPLPLL